MAGTVDNKSFLKCSEINYSVSKKIVPLARDRGAQIEIIFPYDLITQEEINSLGANAKREIFSRCKSHLDRADMVIALLDGSQVDDGAAWEIGFFYRGKPYGAKIIGVRTDFRNVGESAGAVVNAMVECACDRIALPSEELLTILIDSIDELKITFPLFWIFRESFSATTVPPSSLCHLT
jgi:hypothetical protein